MRTRKSYKPAHVKNPSSIQHLVWLQPGQSLVVRLSKETYQNSKVETSNGHMKVLTCEEKEEEREYLFIQDEMVPEWSAYSSCFLCDIWIDSDAVTAKLVVMLACHNEAKDNFVTAINPDCTDLRLRPHDILEVILYDHRFRDQDEWSWQWNSTCDVKLEQIGYEHMNIHMWERYYEAEADEHPSYAFARCPRTQSENNPWCRQHHFWLRFDDSILLAMQKESGLRHVGNLRFYGWPDRYNKNGGYLSDSFVSLTVDLDNKYRMRVLDTLALKPHGECQKPLPEPVRAAVVNHLRKKKGKVWTPTIRDVSLNLLETTALEAGCNTMSAEPPRAAAGHIGGIGAVSAEVNVCRSYGRCGVHPYYDCDDDYRGIYDWWD